MRTIVEDFQVFGILFSFKHLVYRFANCRSREAPPAFRVSTDISSGADSFPFGIRLRACLTSLCVTSGISGCGAGKWLSLWSFNAYNSVVQWLMVPSQLVTIPIRPHTNSSLSIGPQSIRPRGKLVPCQVVPS